MCKVSNDNPANRRHNFIPSILKPSSNLFSGKFTTCTTFRIWVWLTNFKVSIQTMAFSRVQDSNYIIGTVCCFTRRKKVAAGFRIGKSLPREHVNGAKKGPSNSWGRFSSCFPLYWQNDSNLLYKKIIGLYSNVYREAL